MQTKENLRHRPSYTKDQKVLFHKPNVRCVHCVRVGVWWVRKEEREIERERESKGEEDEKVNRQETHLCLHSSTRDG